MSTRHLVLAALTAALSASRQDDDPRQSRPLKSGIPLWPVAVGIACPPRLHREVVAGGAPGTDFLEVNTEDFLAPGGARSQWLLDVARRHPLSLHGIGLGLGSAAGIDWQHLKRVRVLIDRVKPGLLSEPACFNRVQRHQQPLHAQLRLPVPFSARGLSLLASQVDTVQQTLGRRILIGNLSAYLCWDEDTIREPEFFSALAARTGCGLLVDLGSLQVNALNRGLAGEAAMRDGIAWLDEIDAAAVGQYHLAGHAPREGLVVDDHGSRIGEDGWALYRHALARIGARPTRIAWERGEPSLALLGEEVARARLEQSGFDREVIAPPPPRPSPRSAPRPDRGGHDRGGFRAPQTASQEAGHAVQ